MAARGRPRVATPTLRLSRAPSRRPLRKRRSGYYEERSLAYQRFSHDILVAEWATLLRLTDRRTRQQRGTTPRRARPPPRRDMPRALTFDTHVQQRPQRQLGY